MANVEQLTEKAGQYAKKLDEVRVVVRPYLFPKEGSKEPKDMTKLGDATLALEVIVSIINLFVFAKTLSPISAVISHADLLFGLNSNTFWLKHANYLMPLVQTSYSAMQDFHINRGKQIYELEVMKSKLERDQFFWIEIGPAIVGILHGYPAMRQCSHELKESLETLYKELIAY